MTRPQCCTEVTLKNSRCGFSLTWTRIKIFTLERRAAGVLESFLRVHVFFVFCFFLGNHSFSCKSWLKIFWRCRAQLFWLTHSCHAHPLDLDSSYNSSCSSDMPPPTPSLGLISKNAPSLLLWWTSSCDARVSNTGMSLCIAPSPSVLYISLSSHVMCSEINNSVTSAPPLPVSRPSVYLRFFVLLLPQLSRAPSNAKFRSGTQADIKHTFQLWRKEAGMWNRISVIDLRVIVTKYPWTAAVYWTCSRVVTEGPSQY